MDNGKVWDAKHLLEIKIKKESVEKQRMTRIVELHGGGPGSAWIVIILESRIRIHIRVKS
jgi:hypothetical protein